MKRDLLSKTIHQEVSADVIHSAAAILAKADCPQQERKKAAVILDEKLREYRQRCNC
jgi:hypothetical protein